MRGRYNTVRKRKKIKRCGTVQNVEEWPLDQRPGNGSARALVHIQKRGFLVG